jgi:hypothetical protein
VSYSGRRCSNGPGVDDIEQCGDGNQPNIQGSGARYALCHNLVNDVVIDVVINGVVDGDIHGSNLAVGFCLR